MKSQQHARQLTTTESRPGALSKPAALACQPPAAGPKESILKLGSPLILVIDDEEDMLELTKTVLESLRYQVLTAGDGRQGVALFKERQQEFNLVITDSNMPGMNGIDVARAIRKLKPEIPIIFSSGNAGEAEEISKLDALHLIRLGKPYNLDQLRKAVDAGLHH